MPPSYRNQAYAAVAGGCMMLFLFIAGTTLRRLSASSGTVVPLPPASESAPAAAPTKSPPAADSPGPPAVDAGLASARLPVTPVPSRLPVVVHVVGRIRQPGVYAFARGARVMDAVARAGGATSLADLEAVNLAAPLEDGAQIYVPRRPPAGPPEAASRPARRPPLSNPAPAGRVPLMAHPGPRPAESGASHPADPGKITSPSQGRVNINRAGIDDLQRLPGIGPAMAQRILRYRQEKGPFRSAEQLLEIGGIGEKRLAEMRDLLEY